MYDILVYIGRFQPFHLGHQSIIDKALTLSKEVVIVVGSSFSSRSIKNPFTFEERRDMISETYSNHEMRQNIKIVPVRDYRYNNQKWITAVQSAVSAATKWRDNPKIGLIGHSKDQSSFYLKMFPNWENIEAPNYNGIDGTFIRQRLFIYGNMNFVSNFGIVSSSTLDIVNNIKDLVVFRTLFEEYEMVCQYKKSWEAAPYPPIFVTVDAVVIQSGHILLVKRKASPGKGLWALPGGFINQSETLLDASIRELKEETRLKVPTPVLKGSIKNQHTFDDPGRSTRGRTITTAFHFELGDSTKLPKVTGADDAEKAKWVPLSEIDPCQMYEDHYDIIDYFVGL